MMRCLTREAIAYSGGDIILFEAVITPESIFSQQADVAFRGQYCTQEAITYS